VALIYKSYKVHRWWTGWTGSILLKGERPMSFPCYAMLMLESEANFRLL